MSARGRIHAMFSLDDDTERELDARLDAHAAEVLAADGQAYPGQLAMLTGLVATLRAVATHGDLTDVRKLLDEHQADDRAARAEGKSSHQADATPNLTDRQQRLLDAIRTHGGEWTTHRVLALFALTDPSIVQRGTARRDLAALHRAGHLVLVDTPDNRHYVLHTRKGGRS